MVKYKSVKSRSNIFKSLGLIALIAFTFYFIYNYLQTGSFSLKPRASEIVTTDVNSCSQLLTDLDCNKLNSRGCSWVVGPSTTKTTQETTLVPEVTTSLMNCEEADCVSGNYGCRYTNITKTVNQTQVQKVFECDDGSGVGQSKCIQLGGAWIQTGTKTVTVPVTTTIKNCAGTYSRTYTVQKPVTKDVVTIVPGVGSCTGTLKPLTVQNTPIPPVGGSGGGSGAGGSSGTTTGTPKPATCSSAGLATGMTKCSTDGKSILVCSGNNVLQTSTCSTGCEVVSGVAKCKTPSRLGCGAYQENDTKTVACGTYGFKIAICKKSFFGSLYWSYGKCNDLASIPKRSFCPINEKTNEYHDPIRNLDYKIPPGTGSNCSPLTMTKEECGGEVDIDGNKLVRTCQSVDKNGNCYNIGKWGPCYPESEFTKISLFYESNKKVKDVVCHTDNDCQIVTNNSHYYCETRAEMGQTFFARCFDRDLLK